MSNISTWAILRVVFTVSLLTGVFSPLLPAIQDDFQLTATMVSLLLTVFGVTRLVIDVPAGRLVRSCRPELLLTMATVAALLGGLGAVFAPSYSVLLLTRVLIGVASATAVVVGLSTLVHVSSSPDAAMSHFYIAMFSAMIISPTIGGLLEGLWGWRAALAVISVIVALTVIDSARPLRRNHFARIHSPATEAANITQLVRTRPILMIYALSFVALALYTGGKLTLLPLYGANHLGLNVTQLGFIFTATAILTPLAMLATARISAAQQKVLCISAGLVLWAIGLAIILIESVPVFIIASACIDLAGGLMYATPYALLTDCIPRSAAGQAMGEVRLPADIAWLVTPPIIGFGLDAGGTVAPVLMLLAVTALALFGVRVFLSRHALVLDVSPGAQGRLTSSQ